MDVDFETKLTYFAQVRLGLILECIDNVQCRRRMLVKVRLGNI